MQRTLVSQWRLFIKFLSQLVYEKGPTLWVDRVKSWGLNYANLLCTSITKTKAFPWALINTSNEASQKKEQALSLLWGISKFSIIRWNAEIKISFAEIHKKLQRQPHCCHRSSSLSRQVMKSFHENGIISHLKIWVLFFFLKFQVCMDGNEKKWKRQRVINFFIALSFSTRTFFITQLKNFASPVSLFARLLRDSNFCTNFL